MKEKKLLIVSTHFPPDARAGTQRVLRFTKYLVKSGWNISVLTLRPEFSLYKTVQDSSLLTKVPTSVEVCRTAVLRLGWPFSGINSYLIPDREAGWIPLAYSQGLKIIKEKRISCLYSTAPPWTAHVICCWLKNRTGVKWVADIRDPWTRRPWMTREDRKGLRYAALKKIEKMVVGSADRVILNTQPLQRDFVSYYNTVAPEKFLTITNGIDADDFRSVNGSSNRRSGPFVITHGGSLYKKRDPRPFLTAISGLLKRDAIRKGEFLVRFVGSIDPTFDMQRWLRELGLQEVVTVEPVLPHNQYLQLLFSSDLLLLIQPETDLQVPSKLFEYMATGKPVLALAHDGATVEIVKQYHKAKIVDPYNLEEIQTATREFIQSGASMEENPASGFGALLPFSAASLSKELDRVMMELLVQ